MAMDPSDEAVEAAIKFLEGYGLHVFDDIMWGALKTAAAIDGDYNAGVAKAIETVRQAAAMEDAGYGHDFTKLLVALEKLKKVKS